MRSPRTVGHSKLLPRAGGSSSPCLCYAAMTIAVAPAVCSRSGLATDTSTPECSCSGVLPPDHVPVPCLCVPQCGDGWAVAGNFTAMARAAGPAPGLHPERTMAKMCHDVAGVSSVAAAAAAVAVTWGCD